MKTRLIVITRGCIPGHIQFSRNLLLSGWVLAICVENQLGMGSRFGYLMAPEQHLWSPGPIGPMPTCKMRFVLHWKSMELPYSAEFHCRDPWWLHRRSSSGRPSSPVATPSWVPQRQRTSPDPSGPSCQSSPGQSTNLWWTWSQHHQDPPWC